MLLHKIFIRENSVCWLKLVNFKIYLFTDNDNYYNFTSLVMLILTSMKGDI